jgi:hypothetical protein
MGGQTKGLAPDATVASAAACVTAAIIFRLQAISYLGRSHTPQGNLSASAQKRRGHVGRIISALEAA